MEIFILKNKTVIWLALKKWVQINQNDTWITHVYENFSASWPMVDVWRVSDCDEVWVTDYVLKYW